MEEEELDLEIEDVASLPPAPAKKPLRLFPRSVSPRPVPNIKALREFVEERRRLHEEEKRRREVLEENIQTASSVESDVSGLSGVSGEGESYDDGMGRRRRRSREFQPIDDSFF